VSSAAAAACVPIVAFAEFTSVNQNDGTWMGMVDELQICELWNWCSTGLMRSSLATERLSLNMTLTLMRIYAVSLHSK
jgi:hypothetical protein